MSKENRKLENHERFSNLQQVASEEIKAQDWKFLIFYAIFGLSSVVLLFYYLSDTLFHFTTPQQFPINSFTRFPLTVLIFPAELFSLLFGLYFVYTLFTDRLRNPPPLPLKNRARTRIAILLPVYHEPKEIVERTLKACRNVRWPGGVKIYLLDDSTNAPDKRNMAELARKYFCVLVTRKDRVGYKAGNINHALKNAVMEDFFVILDADQAPEPEFLEKTVDHFSNLSVGFVQTPQYFVNEKSVLERAVKVGNNIFYHAQCVSKARDGALPFCGTNAVIRTEAFRKVNGFAYYTATEDIELGLRMNEAGYHGVYVPHILIKGYAPPDFKAYCSQQYRWANGNLAILRECWLKILGGKFSLRHQIHTFFTLGWWMIGITTLVYMIVPLISLYTGMSTHHTWLPTAIIPILYANVVLGVGMIYMSLQQRTSDKITLADALLQYSLITNSVFIYARAAVNALFKRYIGFVRTNKVKSASSLGLVKWNLLLSAVCFGSSVYALYYAAVASSITQVRAMLPISVWLLFYSLMLASSIMFVEVRPAIAPALAPAVAARRQGVAA